jgi:hypothetical protein
MLKLNLAFGFIFKGLASLESLREVGKATKSNFINKWDQKSSGTVGFASQNCRIILLNIKHIKIMGTNCCVQQVDRVNRKHMPKRYSTKGYRHSDSAETKDSDKEKEAEVDSAIEISYSETLGWI